MNSLEPVGAQLKQLFVRSFAAALEEMIQHANRHDEILKLHGELGSSDANNCLINRTALLLWCSSSDGGATRDKHRNKLHV